MRWLSISGRAKSASMCGTETLTTHQLLPLLALSLQVEVNCFLELVE